MVKALLVLEPVVERRYPLRDVDIALRHVGDRRSPRQTAIEIAR